MKTLLRIILGCTNVYLAANLFYYLIVKPIVNAYIFEKIEGQEFHDSDM